jgi:hypothetical protein
VHAGLFTEAEPENSATVAAERSAFLFLCTQHLWGLTCKAIAAVRQHAFFLHLQYDTEFS